MTSSDALRGNGDAASFVDLHAHSTASDGSRAPREVPLAAKAAGLSAIALTDHDTLAGVEEAMASGREAGIRVIAGVELSAVEDDHETHLLGLHILERVTLQENLESLRGMRVQRAERIVRRLNELGVAVSMEAVLKEAAGGAVGRPHVARALIAGKFVGDSREAFDRYLGNGRAAFVAKDRLTMSDAIAMIHRAGGIAVIAHPGGGLTRERVKALVADGMDGIEVLHPSHSWDDARHLDALVTEFGLVRSGGSDWHGAQEGTRILGVSRVPATWLVDQERRAIESRARRVA